MIVSPEDSAVCSSYPKSKLISAVTIAANIDVCKCAKPNCLPKTILPTINRDTRFKMKPMNGNTKYKTEI